MKESEERSYTEGYEKAVEDISEKVAAWISRLDIEDYIERDEFYSRFDADKLADAICDIINND